MGSFQVEGKESKDLLTFRTWNGTSLSKYISILGWTSRAQFEETWAALLGVLSSPPMADDTTVEVGFY